MVRRGGEHTRIDPKKYTQKLTEYPDSMKEVLDRGITRRRLSTVLKEVVDRGITRRRLSTVLKELKLPKGVKANVGLLPETIHDPELSVSALKAKPGSKKYGINFMDQSPTEIHRSPLYERTVPAKAGRKTRKHRRKSHRRRR
jgi:hypothetical protein